MSRPRAADDFETIRARLDELQRERAAGERVDAAVEDSAASRDNAAERRRRARIAGLPPPWAPTLFFRDA